MLRLGSVPLYRYRVLSLNVIFSWTPHVLKATLKDNDKDSSPVVDKAHPTTSSETSTDWWHFFPVPSSATQLSPFDTLTLYNIFFLSWINFFIWCDLMHCDLFIVPNTHITRIASLWQTDIYHEGRKLFGIVNFSLCCCSSSSCCCCYCYCCCWCMLIDIWLVVVMEVR